MSKCDTIPVTIVLTEQISLSPIYDKEICYGKTNKGKYFLHYK